MKARILAAAVAAALLVPTPALALDWMNVIQGAATAAKGFLITPEDEVAIGQAIMDEMLEQTPAYPDAGVQAYVKRVGDQLAIQSRAPYRFTFTVIDSNEVNAFAAPGGFVFVTTGALRLMTTESQLAGVLGHEVAHVAKRHGIEAIKKSMLAQGLAQAVLGDQGSLVQAAANIGTNLILKGFDRGAESESDDFGSQYAAAAGYDPRGIEEFLTTLGQHAGETPIWLMPVASHPRSDDRVKSLATKRPAVGGTPKIGAEEYQANVLAVIGVAGGKPKASE